MQKLTIRPKNLQFNPFSHPGSHFEPPGSHYGIKSSHKGVLKSKNLLWEALKKILRKFGRISKLYIGKVFLGHSFQQKKLGGGEEFQRM